MFRSSAWVFFSKLLVAGLNFTTIVILSRWLGPVERGICGWYLVVIALSLVFCDLIAGPAAGYLLKEHDSKSIRIASYAWSFLVSLITTGVAYLLDKINLTEFLFLFSLCWLNAVYSIHLHLLLAKNQFKWFNRLSVLNPLVTLLLLVCFFVGGEQSRIFYLLSLCISWMVSSLCSLVVLRKHEHSIKSLNLRSLLKSGFGNGMQNQASHLLGLLNNRLVYFILPAATLGVYANAVSLAEASLMIPGSLGQVLYATSLRTTGNGTGLTKVSNSLVISTLLLLCVFILVWILPESIYSFLFGPSFRSIKPFLIKLSGLMVFYGGYLICSYWQSSKGQFAKNIIANVAGLAVNGIITTVAFVSQKYNLETAIWALGGGYAVMFIVSLVIANPKKANATADD